MPDQGTVSVARPRGRPFKRSTATTHKRDRKRGKPSLPTFDFSKLADDTLLDTQEAASVVRRVINTLEQWRKNPKHPLQWERVADRPMYRAGALRVYMRGTVGTEPQAT